MIDPAAILGDSSLASSTTLLSDDEDASNGLVSVTTAADPIQQRNGSHGSSATRICLIVDANITSYLMMGSLSPGFTSAASFIDGAFNIFA